MAAKELFVVAGPNGSGKTTFAEEFLTQQQCIYISVDRIAEEIASNDPTSARVAAGREFLHRLEERLSGTETFLVESTLSGRAFLRTLERAKLSGFEITVIFLYLDSADTCVLRIQERVRKGGHDIPEADVRRRFSRSLANFWQLYRQIADHWLLVYNGGHEFQDVAIGTGAAASVRDESLFRQFLECAGIDTNG